MPNPSNTKIQEFFDGLETYAIVIRENYMMHDEIIRWINSRCQLPANGKMRMRVLEVGCGDAYVVSKLAEHIAIESYTGIDLSANALQRAKGHLDQLIENILLIQGDITEEVLRLEGKFDLILAGYVLHHLHTPEKIRMIGALRQLLSVNGRFILYDVTMNAHDSREQYNDRSLASCDANWVALDANQLLGIRQHVTTYDFPESSDTWKRLAAENGLRLSASEYLDSGRFFCIMEFTLMENMAH